MGVVLGPNGYAKMKAAVLREARMAWNKIDKSNTPRFQDSSVSDVASACSQENRECSDGLQP